MKRIFIAILFSAMHLLVSAQDDSARSGSVINITGMAELSLNPEKIIISYSINSISDNYSDAIADMTERIDELTVLLTKVGFSKKEIKTSNFDIRKNRKYRNGTPKGDEHTATQSLEIRFNHSKKRLLEILNTTVSSEVAPSISIAFGLSDKQASETREKLIEMAVKDAKDKAELLVSEAGYQIEGIVAISYGNSFPRPYNHQSYSVEMDMGMRMAKGNISNFEAKNLVLRDRVSITYSIKRGKKS